MFVRQHVATVAVTEPMPRGASQTICNNYGQFYHFCSTVSETARFDIECAFDFSSQRMLETFLVPINIYRIALDTRKETRVAFTVPF